MFCIRLFGDKTHLDKVIAPKHSSFYCQKIIVRQFIVAQKVVHLMRFMKGKKGFMTIKIDLEKT